MATLKCYDNDLLLNPLHCLAIVQFDTRGLGFRNEEFQGYLKISCTHAVGWGLPVSEEGGREALNRLLQSHYVTTWADVTTWHS